MELFKVTTRDWKPELFKEFFYSPLFAPVRCSLLRLRSFLFRHLPVLCWLPKYKVKEKLLYDVISGVSAGTVQVPQGWVFISAVILKVILGSSYKESLYRYKFFRLFFPGMAFALLANLPPVNGLYSSFFPLIPYFFMGTAQQMVPGKSEWFSYSRFMQWQW